MASKSLFGGITSVDIGIRSLSDHAWVTCQFARKATDGKGPNWLLNKSLLSDPTICETATNEITNYFLLNKDCGVPSGMPSRQSYGATSFQLRHPVRKQKCR